MRDFTEDLADLHRRVDDAHGYLRIDAARTRAGELEAEIGKPDLWDDPDRARTLTSEFARLNDDITLVDALERRVLFMGEHDERDAICVVNFGAGGTDAQDWTDMLRRMFTRWAERRGFTVEIDEVQPGTEAGISSSTFTIKGRYAYGLLQGERGVH